MWLGDSTEEPNGSGVFLEQISRDSRVTIVAKKWWSSKMHVRTESRMISDLKDSDEPYHLRGSAQPRGSPLRSRAVP